MNILIFAIGHILLAVGCIFLSVAASTLGSYRVYKKESTRDDVLPEYHEHVAWMADQYKKDLRFIFPKNILPAASFIACAFLVWNIFPKVF